MRVLNLIIILFLILMAKSNSNEIQIIAKIQNQVITSTDLKYETEYLKLLNPQINALPKKEMSSIALESLRNDIIKKIEITRNFKFEIDENLYNQIFTNFYKNLDLKNSDEFKKFINNKNLNIEYIRNKIIINNLWNKAVYTKYKNQINIDEKKIRTEIKKKVELNSELIEFDISEIFISNKNLNKENELIIQIKSNIDKIGFENTALKFSDSNSSQFGGKIGWIKETELSENILKIISKISINQITEPIKTPGGIVLIKLNNLKKTKINKDIDKLFEQNINYEINKEINKFSKIYFNKIKDAYN